MSCRSSSSSYNSKIEELRSRLLSDISPYSSKAVIKGPFSSSSVSSINSKPVEWGSVTMENVGNICNDESREELMRENNLFLKQINAQDESSEAVRQNERKLTFETINENQWHARDPKNDKQVARRNELQIEQLATSEALKTNCYGAKITGQNLKKVENSISFPHGSNNQKPVHSSNNSNDSEAPPRLDMGPFNKNRVPASKPSFKIPPNVGRFEPQSNKPENQPFIEEKRQGEIKVMAPMQRAPNNESKAKNSNKFDVVKQGSKPECFGYENSVVHTFGNEDLVQILRNNGHFLPKENAGNPQEKQFYSEFLMENDEKVMNLQELYMGWDGIKEQEGRPKAKKHIFKTKSSFSGEDEHPNDRSADLSSKNEKNLSVPVKKTQISQIKNSKQAFGKLTITNRKEQIDIEHVENESKRDLDRENEAKNMKFKPEKPKKFTQVKREEVIFLEPNLLCGEVSVRTDGLRHTFSNNQTDEDDSPSVHGEKGTNDDWAEINLQNKSEGEKNELQSSYWSAEKEEENQADENSSMRDSAQCDESKEKEGEAEMEEEENEESDEGTSTKQVITGYLEQVFCLLDQDEDGVIIDVETDINLVPLEIWRVLVDIFSTTVQEKFSFGEFSELVLHHEKLPELISASYDYFSEN